jgi:hypothetical protein
MDAAKDRPESPRDSKARKNARRREKVEEGARTSETLLKAYLML